MANEKRLIDANALISEYDRVHVGEPGKARKLIEDAPTVDDVPVKRGRWEEADWFEPDCHSFGTIRTPKAALRCSNCKHCFKKELLWKDNYCPNCGAKIDLED